MKQAKGKPSNSLRIIAGKWRSRKLSFPDLEGLRPTADRVRETLFNWLQERIVRADCLDLFAGSGACGIEALSRGAKQVTFLDVSPLAIEAIRSNLGLLQAGGFSLVCEDSLTWLSSLKRPEGPCFDIAFIDPPFASSLLGRSIAALEASGLLREEALIYLEAAQEIESVQVPGNWQLRKSKRAGMVYYYLYQRHSQENEQQ
jgi:16S rRNA (guanine966-N2)-methyltransferase